MHSIYRKLAPILALPTFVVAVFAIIPVSKAEAVVDFGQCQLQISKTVDKANAVIGDTLTYSITFKNVGTADCTGSGVKIEDVVDVNLDFLSETHSSGVDSGYNGTLLYTVSSRTLTWNANVLTPDESGTITWKGKVKTPSVCGSFNIENIARITALEYANLTEWIDSNKVVTNVSNPCPPPLIVSCAVSSTTVNVGAPVTWTGSATGGVGSYVYSWSGTNSLTGATSTVTKTYSSAGAKTGTITVTSGSVSSSATCNTTVVTPPPPPQCILEIVKSVDKTTAQPGDFLTYTLVFKNKGTANCTGDGVRVKDIVDSKLNYISETHSSNVIGGHHSGFPLYSSTTRTLYWNAGTLIPGEIGTTTFKAQISTTSLACGLTTISNKASITGDQYSWQEVFSNTVSTSVTKNCPPPLVVSCAVSPATTTTGSLVTWTSGATGGTGSYVYSWTGTNILTGSSATTTKTYASAGTKTGTVTVTSGTLSSSATCNMTVVAPPVQPATLIVKKVVINDDGGTKVASDFVVHVTTNGTTHVVGSPAVASATGTVFILPAGSYVVAENNPYLSGYQLVGITGDCSASGAVTLVAGQTKQCTITNNDPALPPPPPFNANCAASPVSVQVGGNITWSVTATGGTGIYGYSWTGTDGLLGTIASITKQYSAAGTKNATVLVTSGNATTTANCTATVTSPPPGPVPLTASCVVSVGANKINIPVTYSSVVSGGTGSYSYSWSGTDGLSGTSDSVTTSYLNNGTKTATVTVTSGSETITSNLCSVNIIPDTITGCTFGCGGFEQPTVVLYKEAGSSTLASFVYLAQQSFTPKVAGVYLSSIPYTGITGTVAVVVFLVGVIIWSLFVAFAVESKRYSVQALLARWRMKKKVGNPKEENIVNDSSTFHPYDVTTKNKINDEVPIRAYDDVDFSDVGEEVMGITPFGELVNKNNVLSSMNQVNNHDVPNNLPVASTTSVAVPQAVRDAIFARARSKKALVSEEAGKAIALASNNSIDAALELLDGAIVRTEEKYLKEDGWILLNREKVAAYLKSRGVKVEEVSVAERPTAMRSFTHEEPIRIPEKPVSPPPASQFAAKAPVQLRDVINSRQPDMNTGNSRVVDNGSNGNNGNRNGEVVATIGSAVSFLKAVSSGDSRAVMDTVRSIKASGASLENFASDLILELDRAYRARVEGDPSIADQEISRIVAPWGVRDLEEIIAILFSVAEKEYSSESTGLRLVALRLSKLRR